MLTLHEDNKQMQKQGRRESKGGRKISEELIKQ